MTLEDTIREAVEAAVAKQAEDMRKLTAEIRQLLRVLPPAMGSKKDAARLLGISEKSVERAIARGEIEAQRVGSRVVIDLSKLRVEDDEDELGGRRRAGGRL